MPMTKFAEVTIASTGAAVLQFTNIPQTGKDLLILLSARSTSSLGFRLNGDTGSNYSQLGLESNFGGSPFANPYTDTAAFVFNNASGTTANTFSSSKIYIPNYTASIQKSITIDSVAENNDTSGLGMIKAVNWLNTAAVTSFTTLSYTFEQNTTAYLYIIS